MNKGIVLQVRWAAAGEGRYLMRKLAWLILSGTMLTGVPAYAQTYDPHFPVCMKAIAATGGGEYNDCTFTSLTQCAASASGRSAQCLINPYFAFPGTQPAGRVARGRHQRVY
jgi:uncharacterized protein DUF3551